jgi:hypothetical protein
MTLDIHPNECNYPEAHALAVQTRSIPFDNAIFLKAPNSPEAGRRRETDAFGEFKIRQTTIGLQGFQNVRVD